MPRWVWAEGQAPPVPATVSEFLGQSLGFLELSLPPLSLLWCKELSDLGHIGRERERDEHMVIREADTWFYLLGLGSSTSLDADPPP